MTPLTFRINWELQRLSDFQTTARTAQKGDDATCPIFLEICSTLPHDGPNLSIKEGKFLSSVAVSIVDGTPVFFQVVGFVVNQGLSQHFSFGGELVKLRELKI